MARKIIVLTIDDNAGRGVDVTALLWADVPLARQRFYANPSRTTDYLDVTADELTALRNGSVAERHVRVEMPVGTTTAQIRTRLVNMHGLYQAFVNNENPWSRYGSSWDGAAWTAVTVA